MSLFYIFSLSIFILFISQIVCSSSISIYGAECSPENLFMKCSVSGYSEDANNKQIKIIYGNDVKDQPINKTEHYLLLDYIYIPESIGNFTVFFELYRFQPLTNYRIRFLDVNNNSLYEFVQLSGSSGDNDLDSKKYLKIKGIPTWDLIFFDYGSNYIAIDHTGWVVFVLPLYSLLPPQRANCKSQYIDNGKNDCDRSKEDCHYRYLAIVNGTIGYYYPNATAINYLDNYECNFFGQGGFFNHELRASTKYNGNAYAIRMLMKNIKGYFKPQLGQIVTKWDFIKNEIVDITDSFKLVNIDDTLKYLFDYATTINCTDIANYQNGTKARDITHLNAISDSKTVGQEGILVSSRSLSILFLIDPNTGEKLWQISSKSNKIESDFTFLNESDIFYNQHDPQLLSDGHLILINNDDTDPSHQERRTYASEYLINFENKTIELIWKFTPDIPKFFSEHGGGISELKNGNRLVCFTTTPNSGINLDLDSLCFEIDQKGNEVSRAFLHVLNENTLYTYRGESIDTINGESVHIRNVTLNNQIF